MLTLITGATSGVGRALAFLLHKKGHRLRLCGQDQEKLEQLKYELEGSEIWRADLANSEQRAILAKHIQETPYDLVVNNAGFGLYGDVDSQSMDILDSMIRLNCTAVVELSQAAARGALSRSQPCIILNVSSVAGEFPTPGMSVYGATKAFVTNFSQAMNFELKNRGVSVLANCPGRIETNFSSRAGKKLPHKGASRMRMTADYAAEQIWLQICKKESKRIYHAPYWITSKLKNILKNTLMSSIYRTICSD